MLILIDFNSWDKIKRYFNNVVIQQGVFSLPKEKETPALNKCVLFWCTVHHNSDSGTIVNFSE